MSTDARAQLAELRRLSMAELKRRWRDLIGTDPPQYSRSFLVSRLAYRLQELAYGGPSASALAKMEALVALVRLLSGQRPTSQRRSFARFHRRVAGTHGATFLMGPEAVL